MKDNKLFIKFSNNSNQNFKNYTLIMPSVSVGNVGQLAVDILVTTLSPEKIALVHHPALLPLIGHNPYCESSTEISTASDLHLCEEKGLLILQIRSPLIKEERDDFLTDLTEWIKRMSFKDVIVLSSCHACLRHDHQLVGSQFRYLTSSLTHPQIESLKKNIEAVELEDREDSFGVKRKFVPGAGFMYKLLDKCSVPSVALMKFVDEGDNTRDAFSLVAFLNAWTKYQETNDGWKAPFSWKNLYGAPPPSLIY